MAENKNKVEADIFDSEDPFAELSRIMGLEQNQGDRPRPALVANPQPEKLVPQVVVPAREAIDASVEDREATEARRAAKRAAKIAARQAILAQSSRKTELTPPVEVPKQQVSDDLGIDLERELMAAAPVSPVGLASPNSSAPVVGLLSSGQGDDFDEEWFYGSVLGRGSVAEKTTPVTPAVTKPAAIGPASSTVTVETGEPSFAATAPETFSPQPDAPLLTTEAAPAEVAEGLVESGVSGNAMDRVPEPAVQRIAEDQKELERFFLEDFAAEDPKVGAGAAPFVEPVVEALTTDLKAVESLLARDSGLANGEKPSLAGAIDVADEDSRNELAFDFSAATRARTSVEHWPEISLAADESTLVEHEPRNDAFGGVSAEASDRPDDPDASSMMAVSPSVPVVDGPTVDQDVEKPKPAFSHLGFDDTLEKELNALLGSPPLARPETSKKPWRLGTSWPRFAPVPANEDRVIPRSERFAAITPVAEERFVPDHEAAAAQEPQFALEAELSPEIEEVSREIGLAPEHATVSQGVAPTFEPTLPIASEPSLPVVASLSAEKEPELDFHFDDHAFDSALAREIEGDHHLDLKTQPIDLAEHTEISVPKSAQDPYSALAALSESLTDRVQPAFARTERGFGMPELPHLEPARPLIGPAWQHAPDIETVEVSEQAVTVTDDLNLPDFEYEARQSQPGYDDIDAEFNSLLAEMNGSDPLPAPTPESWRSAAPTSVAAYASQSWSDAPYRIEVPNTQANYSVYNSHAVDDRSAGSAQEFEDIDRHFQDMDFAYDPDSDEETQIAPEPLQESPPRRRGLLAAGIVGGIALLGGVAAVALSFAHGGSVGSPVLVKADTAPVKIKPENPGGTIIPNQENRVYDTVSKIASNTPAPSQAKLVPSSEEPMAMPEPDPTPDTMPAVEGGTDGKAADSDVNGTSDPHQATSSADTETIAALAGGTNAPQPAEKVVTKGEDRLTQADADSAPAKQPQDIAAVTPRKVRTMVVKSDGTLVARDDPAPAPLSQKVGSAQEGVVKHAVSTPQPATLDTSSADKASAAPGDVAATAAKTKPSTTPKSVPIAPPRPSDQPVDVVGEVKADKVASITPTVPVTTSAPSASGSWAVQISSQPNEAAAQASFKDLTRRYGNVLSGHNTGIVKADIAGKGTFWRVRVAVDSRDEAVKLCESYKSAGGTCFVSR